MQRYLNDLTYFGMICGLSEGVYLSVYSLINRMTSLCSVTVPSTKYQLTESNHAPNSSSVLGIDIFVEGLMDDAGDRGAIDGNSYQNSHMLNESLSIFSRPVQRINPHDHLETRLRDKEGMKGNF